MSRSARRAQGARGGARLRTALWLMLPLMLLNMGAAGAGMADRAQRSTVAGIDLVTYPTGVKNVVVIAAVLPAGDAMAAPGEAAIPTLVGMMLDRGTKKLDKFAIADQLESVGADISIEVGVQSVEVRGRCLRKDLPLVMSLIAAELRTPAFQSAEFAKAKQQFIGSLESSLENTDTRAQEAFGSTVFPAGHPNHVHTTEELMAAAKSASLEQVKAFHARYYGPAHMTLVLVGDVSDDAARALVANDFAGWSGGQDYLRPAVVAAPVGTHSVTVPLRDKPSVTVLIGQATGLRYRDPDALALRLGTAIFGRGFTGRLMHSVRDQEGLTYDIGAGLSGDAIADGAWEVSATFAPALLDRGVAATRRELERWWSEGVSEQELADHKEGLIGTYFVSLATTGGLASTLITTLQRGYDLAWLDGYPQALRAITVEQVNRAVKSHLDPFRMIQVEAGSVKTAN